MTGPLDYGPECRMAPDLLVAPVYSLCWRDVEGSRLRWDADGREVLIWIDNSGPRGAWEELQDREEPLADLLTMWTVRPGASWVAWDQSTALRTVRWLEQMP